MQGFRKLAVAAMFAALPLAACDDADLTQSGTGRVSVLLTDAPGDIESAVVTISSIYFQGEGADSLGSGRVFLVGSADADAEIETDLIDLRNSVQELIRDREVPAGRYNQLRIVLSGACIVVDGDAEDADTDDRVYATSGYTACGAADGNLQATSILRSGLKVNLPNGGFDVEEGSTESLLIDFDVSQSFGHQAGNSGQWVMRPVIKASELTAASTVTVNVALGSGITLPTAVTMAGINVRLTNADGSTEEAALDANGAATFRYLMPGTYTVSLVGPAGFTLTATPGLTQTVNASSGATATSTFTITGFTATGG